MRKYEVVYITDPAKTDEQVAEVADKIKAFVEKEEGTVDLVEAWGKKKLAYVVKKNRYGFYTLMHVSGPFDIVVKLERHLRHDESVIKFITLQHDERSAVKPPSMEGTSFYGRDSYGSRDRY